MNHTNFFGILNVNKPAGLTSHDVVDDIRRMTGMKRVGHGGTLDPAATGVLPILVGSATKLSSFVLDMDKSYVAAMTLGITTDTLDATGRILSVTEGWTMSIEDVRSAAKQFTGPILQVPPMVSAVRVGGKRLYELARKNRPVQRSPRPVTVYCLKVCAKDGVAAPLTSGSSVLLHISCSKGTYIRSLCDDMGQTLMCGAHMSSLVRTSVGPFTLDEAQTLDQLAQIDDDGARWRRAFINPRVLLDAVGLPRICVSDDAAIRLRHGQKVEVKDENDGILNSEDDGLVYAVEETAGAVVCIAAYDRKTRTMSPRRVF